MLGHNVLVWAINVPRTSNKFNKAQNKNIKTKVKVIQFGIVVMPPPTFCKCNFIMIPSAKHRIIIARSR